MIEQKLRALVLSIRRTPTPIADIIPLLNEAATEVERLRAQLSWSQWSHREPPHCPTCDCPGERSAALTELAQMDQDMRLAGPTSDSHHE